MLTRRMHELAAEIEAASAQYAEEATKLSDNVERFERFLQDLPGKVPASVTGGSTCLDFSRAEKGAWRLHIHCAKRSALLTEAPIELKVVAVRFFEPLLERILAIHRAKAKDIATAVKISSNLLADEGEA